MNIVKNIPIKPIIILKVPRTLNVLGIFLAILSINFKPNLVLYKTNTLD